MTRNQVWLQQFELQPLTIAHSRPLPYEKKPDVSVHRVTQYHQDVIQSLEMPGGRAAASQSPRRCARRCTVSTCWTWTTTLTTTVMMMTVQLVAGRWGELSVRTCWRTRRRPSSSPIWYTTSHYGPRTPATRDDHGNGIPNGNGNPMGFPWEWELVTKLGMGMGRNGKQPVWEWEWPLFPWESIPIGRYSVKLM